MLNAALLSRITLKLTLMGTSPCADCDLTFTGACWLISFKVILQSPMLSVYLAFNELVKFHLFIKIIK